MGLFSNSFCFGSFKFLFVLGISVKAVTVIVALDPLYVNTGSYSNEWV